MIKSYFIKLMILCSFFAFSCSSILARTYIQKAPYAGMGKKSKVNGLIKTKSTSGYIRRTSRGYIRVNPYARSR